MLSGRIRATKLIADLRGIRTKLPKATKDADARVAADVARRSRERAAGLGGVHAHVASGIESIGPQIQLNAGAQPAILGAEFGGGGRPRTRQFPPYRGSGSNAGYMVYPTLRDDSKDVVERYGEALDKLLD